MLVKCPKCGFDQPKDTYCAKCGVEMDRFKPVKAPAWKRLLRSPFFSLLIFLGLGYGALFFLRNPSQMEITLEPNFNQVSRSSTPTPAQVNPSPSPPLDPSKVHTTIASSSSPYPTPTESPPAGSPLESKDVLAEEPESNHHTEEKNNHLKSFKGPLELKVVFVEAPTLQVQRFFAEASDETNGDSGEMSYAIVKNADKWLQNRTFTELDAFSKKVPNLKTKLHWFNGSQHPESGLSVGLNFQVAIQERTEGHLIGELQITRSLVDSVTEGYIPTRKEFSTRFETEVGALIGLAGLMPHNPMKSDDKDWLQEPLLRIFLSQPFLKNDHELLILLQFKGDSK